MPQGRFPEAGGSQLWPWRTVELDRAKEREELRWKGKQECRVRDRAKLRCGDVIRILGHDVCLGEPEK